MTAHGAGHTAYLRVYEPLAAFEGVERRRWEAYLAEQEAPSTAAGAALEHEAALQALVGLTPSVLPDLPEHAYVTEVDGVTLLCPWRTRLRALEALEEFLSDVPRELVSAWLPAGLAESVGDELDAHRLAHPDERVPQLTSTWHVPLRWFVLVDAGEREVHLGPSPRQGAVRTGRSLVYRTPMSRARRRVARALAVLRRTVEDGVVTAGVEDLGAGWRSSTRARWSSSTTAAGAPARRRRAHDRRVRPATVAAALGRARGRGTGRAGRGGVRAVTAG
jgi:hypothetical protein